MLGWVEIDNSTFQITSQSNDLQSLHAYGEVVRIKHSIDIYFCQLSYSFLTLRAHYVLKLFEDIKVILLYWLAGQQQTSAFRQQKFFLFYPNFSEEFN